MPASLSRLLYAASDHNADQLYFGRVGVPDAFISFTVGRKKLAVVSALEFARVRRDSDFDTVLPLERYIAKAKALFPRRKAGAAEVIAAVARDFNLRTFAIPGDFPAGLAMKLTQLKLRLEIVEGAFFPEREIKTADEAKAIRQGNRCSAAGIAAAESVLRASRIVGRKLMHRGAPLTSERLKIAIETACIEAGAISIGTIAAGGDQACDPHHRGEGLLRPNELIIVDVFPRVTASGYHGDMTRTFLKGRASDAQRALVNAVAAGQRAALRMVRAGVNGRDVHELVVDIFQRAGFETKHGPKGSVGFFHGTGHGLGLDVHEPPRMSASVDYLLKEGSVVTVEPGLYYPGLGGCRIEDVVQVTSGKARLLSSYPYDWELK